MPERVLARIAQHRAVERDDERKLGGEGLCRAISSFASGSVSGSSR